MRVHQTLAKQKNYFVLMYTVVLSSVQLTLSDERQHVTLVFSERREICIKVVLKRHLMRSKPLRT